MARVFVQPAHNAEVNEGKPAGVVDNEVSLMHVGVKKPGVQRLLQEHMNDEPRERLAVDAAFVERGDVAEGRAVDPFDGEDAPRRQRPDHAGHAHAGFAL